ncbi:MAG: siderophore ABC transporter substrate-binding protein [Beutenbergiaceae bacterium]
MALSRPIATACLATVSVLALVGCSASEASTADETAAQESTAEEMTSVEIEDNLGTHTIDVPPTSVVALDNRTFQTLSDWGIELSAAAVSLMPDTIGYTSEESLPDVGNHREPDLEVIVAAQPDLVINGQRFTQYQDDITALVPDASVLVLDPREGEPFDAELKRQVTVLGEVFGKQAEAEQLVGEFEAAVDRVVAAYDPADTVMAVNVSGGEIGYIAPTVGRALGPVFDLAALTPALQIDDASGDHQGDDISVEAIADANPDWILVMDRDAAISADDPAYEPAADVIENSQALAGVSAIQNAQTVYMPADTYTNEGIQTYTEFLNDFADALEAAN